jgi:hypothetical protein
MFNKMIFILYFLLSVSDAYSKVSTEELKTISALEGNYLIQKGSNKKCQDGELKIVGTDLDRGVRIGHKIFLGPFVDFEKKPSKTTCRISSKFTYQNNLLTAKTVVDECPNEKNKEAGTSTEVLTFNKNSLKYHLKETGYSCLYKKTEQVRK